MLLQLSKLSHSFGGSKNVLDGISLDLEKGKIYALMGANGSGKTTLLNILTGFIRAQNGTVFFETQLLDGLEPYKINHLGISRTFQDLRTIKQLTVMQNIILSMKNNPSDFWLNALLPNHFYANSDKRLREKAADIMRQYFLDDISSALAAEISFGQQKLLALACCVASDASLFLLDEPIAGIQPEYQTKMRRSFKQLKDLGKTIFFIEHNTDFISEVADEIFFLNGGRIYSFDNMDSLKSNDEVAKAYM